MVQGFGKVGSVGWTGEQGGGVEQSDEADDQVTQGVHDLGALLDRPDGLGQRLPYRRLPPPEESGRRPGPSSRGAEAERCAVPEAMLALPSRRHIHDLHDAAGEAELRRSPSPDSTSYRCGHRAVTAAGESGAEPGAAPKPQPRPA